MGQLKNKALKGVAWSSVERFSVAGVNFIIGLVLARLLMPADYGMVTMLAIFMSVSQTFIDSGFSNALIRKINRTEKDNATVFYFNILIGFVCYAILYISAPWIAAFYKMPLLVPLTRIIAINLILNSFCVVQQALLTIRLDFRTQAKISLTGVALSGITGIYIAYKGGGVWALVTQSVLGSIIRTILLWLFTKWKPTTTFSLKSFNELFSYGSKLLASGLLDTTYNNLYSIIIGKIYKPTNLGIFSRAEQWAQFPSVNITGILQRVTFPVLSTIQNEDERISINYRRILRLSGFVVFPIMIGLAAVASPLVRLVLTDKWKDCIILLQLLCFGFMWYPIHAINLNLLQVKGRSDIFLRLEIYKKIVGVGILFVTLPMGLIAMCVGRIISSLLCLFLNTYYTGKIIHLGFYKQMKDLIPTLFNSLLMGFLIFATIQFIFPL